ncbi:hypothetical protein, partial [Mesorhizobium sp. M7A.F.Ca.CA.004.09.1.2]|uniref:hypothetical protein n=1 Tax=Mesorhizobium sp. M7A.F.Ca.CA.004.09.1.2 TaxID=2496695 RepID=UPI0019D2A300
MKFQSVFCASSATRGALVAAKAEGRHFPNCALMWRHSALHIAPVLARECATNEDAWFLCMVN